ncbi:MAG: polyribonucleotide nucleotidyltransferase [Actinobacteria bacterium]|nr:polyribonucleotide nucleotidyltransferase [Actinomycetota bacterium]MCB9388129.1 polyribonucleotide nucleotidyltransferase [Acidimicrobiia bacterium]
MSSIHSVSREISGSDKTMLLETGRVAALADGSVIVGMGDTRVLVTACAANGVRDGIDFFPLTVDVEERAYAAGKIPGSFFRREGRPGEQAVLTCRLTDRPIRPAFADGYRNETQIVGTVLGVDMVNPHDVAVINGASAALTVSGIPFQGPIGAVRVARVGDDWIAHPSYEQSEGSTFEMVVAGRRADDGSIAIMMVEAGGGPNAWALYEDGASKVDEAAVAQGLEAAKPAIEDAIDLQLELKAKYEAENGPIAPMSYEAQIDYSDEVQAAVAQSATADVEQAMTIADKHDRNARLAEIEKRIFDELTGSSEVPGPLAGQGTAIGRAFRSLQKSIVRSRIVNDGFRIDGRATDELRPISAEVSILSTAHGSALFQRGETQVLSVTTLGMPRLEQMIDSISTLESKRYMHHYNFPPYSVGETGRVGSPKRREIGHGALAERALVPVLPSAEEWPYTLRVVSDVMASNGSTSMASVCGSSLSLMDAGVPIKAPVAGIAMGLVYADGKYTTLTDILGAEDAFGDMDFKVAGTRDFITALQLDTKIDGIPAEVLAQALEQARVARLSILDTMDAAIEAPRQDVADVAPKIVSIEIPLDKVGEVIGPKGKIVRAIQDETGAEIAVDDDGVQGIVTVGATQRSQVDAAVQRINEILNPPQPEEGKTYTGVVVNVTDFGAFVNILPGRDGLLHISKLGRGQRVSRVEDVVQLGQPVDVVVDEIDHRGKVSLRLAGDDAGSADGDAGDAQNSGGDASDGGSRRSDSARSERRSSGRSGGGESGGDRRSDRSDQGGDRVDVSFRQEWDAQAEDQFGELGTARKDERRRSGPPKRRQGGRGRGGRSRGGRNGS